MFYQETWYQRWAKRAWIGLLYALMMAFVATVCGLGLWLSWQIGPMATTRAVSVYEAIGWAGAVVSLVSAVKMAWNARITVDA